MADSLARSEPVQSDPAVFAGATIALEPPMARYSLRARDRTALEQVVGRALPGGIGDMDDGALCLGPDEWLLRLAAGMQVGDGAGHKVSVVEVSERQVAIAVDGPRAVEVLLAGSPLDIENFPAGSGRRTIFEGVEILLIRESETRFVIEVWRSFAEFVRGVLVKAASEL